PARPAARAGRWACATGHTSWRGHATSRSSTSASDLAGAPPSCGCPRPGRAINSSPWAPSWGRRAARSASGRADAAGPAPRLALLERLLLARLARLDHAPRRRDSTLDPGLALVQQAVAQIARQRGVLSIRALAGDLGLSHKQLIAHFTRLVGATPKELARIYRLQQVRDGIDSAAAQPLAQPRTWAHVAHQAGYYDEAPFARDFRPLPGQPPGAYLRLLLRVHAEHPASARALTFLPAE